MTKPTIATARRLQPFRFSTVSHPRNATSELKFTTCAATIGAGISAGAMTFGKSIPRTISVLAITQF